ncbi:DgyrCDS9344 [Dimorphilus gyrociliatus]|uniref:DgyrCDS9344 n=1 Tax=Dimorphilus gyrociliatus TaxID=2664684 RepID=A0A7I8VYW7_9ANNE|nr:DgyrCDS9344 [Dimorphilus gyrociliatus]
MNCQDDAELTRILFDLCQHQDFSSQTLMPDFQMPNKKPLAVETKRQQQNRQTTTVNSTKFRDMESWKESKRIKYRQGQGSFDPYSKKIGQDLLSLARLVWFEDEDKKIEPRRIKKTKMPGIIIPSTRKREEKTFKVSKQSIQYNSFGKRL